MGTIKKKGKKVDVEDLAEVKAGKKPSKAEEKAESKGKKKKGGVSPFGSMFKSAGKKPKNVSPGAKAYLKRVGGKTL